MIEVRLVMSSHEVPHMLELHAQGHAPSKRGEPSLVCGAFTLLLRSFGALMEQQEPPVGEVRAPEPGVFCFAIKSLKGEMVEWYRGAMDVMLRGIFDLHREFPQEIDIVVDRR